MGRHGNTFCPRRAAKNGNATFFLLSTKNGNGNTFCPRRAGNTFCPRRATKGREERQRQHLLSTKGHEGPRRTATATSFCPRRATKGRTKGNATPFVHGGPLGAAENFLLIHGVRGVSGEESGVRGRSGRLSQGAQGLWRGRCAFWWLDDL